MRPIRAYMPMHLDKQDSANQARPSACPATWTQMHLSARIPCTCAVWEIDAAIRTLQPHLELGAAVLGVHHRLAHFYIGLNKLVAVLLLASHADLHNLQAADHTDWLDEKIPHASCRVILPLMEYVPNFHQQETVCFLVLSSALQIK